MSEPLAGATHPARIAILVPCYNEALTIAHVVQDFKKELPGAAVYVFDNRSTDQTAEIAQRAGAIVRREGRQGKGYVIQSMFRGVDADVYVMVDGDGTYPARYVHELIRPVLNGEADQVIGSRLHRGSTSAFKPLNRLGNLVFRLMINGFFRVHITDLLSGYRAFNARVVKSLPFQSRGFESETELTVKCLVRGYRIVEIPIDLLARPAGSFSKIRLVQDGLLIVHTMVALARDYRPLTAFGLVGLALIGCGLLPGAIVIRDYLRTGLVERMPSAVLAVGLILAGLLIGLVGLVLHAVARHFQELDWQIANLAEDELKWHQPTQTP